MDEQNDRETPTPLNRRAMVQVSLAGGVALAAGLVPGLTPSAEAQSAPGASGALPRPVPAARVRRIVTGRNADGKSYIANDEVVGANSIWTTTSEQPLGAPPTGEGRFISKATGETRCFVAAIQPSRDPKPDLKNRAGFHQTPGIAYCFILNGELVFLTDTQEVKVKAGDVVVERNTLHSWRNDTNEPVSMFITTVVGA